MNEKDLGKALLGLDATQLGGVTDSRLLTGKVLERDRRRVRLLTGLTVVLWALAVSGILLVLNIFVDLIPKQKTLMRDVAQGRIAKDHRESLERYHWMVVEKATVMIAASVAVLGLAAIGTVILVLTARGATLRQVNASLVEISEQLRQLKQAGPP
jgi:hypothetical protein